MGEVPETNQSMIEISSHEPKIEDQGNQQQNVASES